MGFIIIIGVIGVEILYGLGMSGSVLSFKDALPAKKASFYVSLLADNIGPLVQEAAPPPADAPPAEQAPEAAPPEQAAPEQAAPEQVPEQAPEAAPEQAAPEQAPEAAPEQAAPEQAPEQPTLEQVPAGVNEEVQTGAPVIEGETANPIPELSTEEQTSVSESESSTNITNIDPSIVGAIATEDALIDQAATPEEKVTTIIDLGEQKINDIGDTTANSDFGSANLVVSRLTDQIDEALGQIGSLPPDESTPLKQNLATFADKAESALRTEQLVVPEGFEQDFEIARAKLLNVQESNSQH